MERLDDPKAAAAWCARAREAGRSLAFVPTMGALHEGHLALVRRARTEAELVVVSVFVNPLQFDDPDDLARYPRDLDADAEALATCGVDLVFTGTLASFFPGSDGDLARIPRVDPGPAAAGLEGEHRAGHFAGVATIVARLFELVRPDVALFGAKDFQQTLVVRDVARRRGGPRILVRPTVRAEDGLALSSRNARLSAEGRERAPGIWRALQATRAARAAGEGDPARLEARLARELAREGLEVEYASVRDPERWAESPAPGASGLVALVAVRVDGVRLIDNLALDAAAEGVPAGRETPSRGRRP